MMNLAIKGAILISVALFSIVTCVAQTANNSKVERVFLGKNGELRSKSIDRNKKKFKYDDGGAFRCNLSVRAIRKAQGIDDPCKEKQVRDFIWDHLQAQRRGHIRVTYAGIDAGTHEFFFIEPDEDGDWNVSWWTIRYSALPPGSSKVYPKKILSAEKVEREKDGEWFIRFRDLDGVIFLNIPSDAP